MLPLWSVRIFGCTHPCLAVVNHVLPGNEMPQDFRTAKLSVLKRARGISRIIIG